MNRADNSVATTEIPSGSDSYHRDVVTGESSRRQERPIVDGGSRYGGLSRVLGAQSDGADDGSFGRATRSDEGGARINRVSNEK